MVNRRAAVQQPATASAALKSKTMSAFLITKDAATNLVNFLSEDSRMAFLAIKECERELDQIEREIDVQLPSAITRVGERKARELIACLRFVTDLERIGDLVLWVAKKLDDHRGKLPQKYRKVLVQMASMISANLADVYRGFVEGDAQVAVEVISRDRELDLVRNRVFRSHLESRRTSDSFVAVEILFMTQALERAGDHVTNLAEELIHLLEERSVRHLPKRVVEI